MPLDLSAWPARHLGALFLLFAAVGAALAMAGSFMTWGEVQIPLLGTVTFDGFDADRDGRMSLSLGTAAVIVAGVGLRPRLRTASAATVAFLGVSITAVAVADMFQLDDQSMILDEISLFSQPLSDVVTTKLGIGLYLVAVGGTLTAFGGVGAFIATKVFQRRLGTLKVRRPSSSPP